MLDGLPLPVGAHVFAFLRLADFARAERACATLRAACALAAAELSSLVASAENGKDERTSKSSQERM